MNIAFILETALIILVVFLIGAILGYLIRCWFFKPQAVVAPSSTPARPVAQSAPVAARSAAPPPAPEKPAEQSPEPLPAASAPAEVKTVEKSPEVSEPEPLAEPEIVSEGEKEPEPSSATKLASPPAPKAAETVETVADDAGKDDSSGKPVGLLEPRNGQKDDLKRIKGIGPKIEATLNELGIFHFDQIAEWSPASIDWVNGFLSFKGRVQRENWIEQSKALASGGETEFSKRVDKGDVPSSKK